MYKISLIFRSASVITGPRIPKTPDITDLDESPFFQGKQVLRPGHTGPDNENENDKNAWPRLVELLRAY